MQSPKLGDGNYFSRSPSLPPHFPSNIPFLMTRQAALPQRASCYWWWTFTSLATGTRGSCLNQLHAPVWAPLTDHPGNVWVKLLPSFPTGSHLDDGGEGFAARSGLKLISERSKISGEWIQYRNEEAYCNCLAESSELARSLRLRSERGALVLPCYHS